MGLFDRFKKTSKESLLGYLQKSISDNSSLEHIVSVFEEMCNMPFKEDMILFETGTYSFTGKPMFNFSLVRQFPNDEEEYYQIHVDVLYIPTEENKDFQRTIWKEDIEDGESVMTAEYRPVEYGKDYDVVNNPDKFQLYIDGKEIK